jgi:hypothetical protein
MSPSAFPFGLDSVARVYASSVSTSISAYEELPGHHLRSTLDLVASTPASEYLDSTETPETEPRATASRHYNPRDDWQRPHIHPSYCYFDTPNSDSTDDTYDLTRECFNIDGASTSDSEDEEPVEGRNTPPHAELPDEQDEAQLLADQGMQLEQIRELQDKLDEERENLRLLQQTLEHERVAHAHCGRARERARDVNHRIVEDRAVDHPVFGRASQNVVTAAMLLRNMLKPSNPDACRARDEIREHLETATMQQAESSALRRREPASERLAEPSRQEREASVHPEHV